MKKLSRKPHSFLDVETVDETEKATEPRVEATEVVPADDTSEPTVETREVIEASETREPVVDAAVPAPRRSVIVLEMEGLDDSDILATDDVASSAESTAGASSEGLPRDQQVHMREVVLQSNKTDDPTIILTFQLQAIMKRAFVSAAGLFTWSLLLLLLEPVFMTVLENSKDRVHTYGKQAIMAVVQVVAPALLLNALGPVIAIFNVEAQLYANPEARMSKLGRLVCTGVLSVLTLPLVSTSVGEIVKVDPRIVSEDLNKFDLMVWNNSESRPIVRKGNGSFVRTNLTNTILRGAVLPYATSLRHCDIADGQKTNAYTSVGYEFLTNDWHSRILPVGLKPSKMYVVPGSSRGSLLVSNLTLSRDEVVVFETLFIRAVYLYIDEVLVQHTALGGPNVATLKTLKNDCIAYAKTHDVSASGDVDHVQHLEDYVRNYFKMSSAWTTVLGARVEDIVVEAGNHFFLQERNVQCITLTLDIPLDNAIWHRQLKEENGELVDTKTLYPGSGDVIYEFDIANECGPDTCGIENRGFAPELKVLALADCPSTSFEDIYGVELENGTSCDNSVSGSSMWLFGFGRRIEGDTFELLDPPANSKVRKARAINPREFHRASIGYFMFPPEELDQTFNAECWADSDCPGLQYQLMKTSADVLEHFVVGKEHVVLGDFGSAFQFEKNLAHS